jgi:hypothetical protein
MVRQHVSFPCDPGTGHFAWSADHDLRHAGPADLVERCAHHGSWVITRAGR